MVDTIKQYRNMIPSLLAYPLLYDPQRTMAKRPSLLLVFNTVSVSSHAPDPLLRSDGMVSLLQPIILTNCDWMLDHS